MNNVIQMVGIREYVGFAMEELYTRMPMMNEWQEQMAREQFTADFLQMGQGERAEAFKNLLQDLAGRRLQL